MNQQNQRNRINDHLSALKRFNMWEEKYPSTFSKEKALESIGSLYEWLPREARHRRLNVRGIQAMRRSLAKLKSRL